VSARAISLTKKRCGGCARTFPVILGTTFVRNRFTVDGLQIHCKQCAERLKAECPHQAWAAFVRIFKDEHPADLVEWTKPKYFEIVGGPDGTLGACSYCGNSLKKWGKGHKIDRIDSRRGHVPDNCVACCSGCNWAKGSMDPSAWWHYLNDLKKRFEPGKFPWQTINPKGPKPVYIPDLSKYALDIQPLLFPPGDLR
jgi:5-methylcytosine-specific restriction endonuclease McrA